MSKDKAVAVLVIAETWWGKGATIAEALAAAREAFPGLTSKGQRYYEAWSSSDPDATVADDGSIRSKDRPAPLRQLSHGKDVTDAAAMLARRYPPPAMETCSACKAERPARHGTRQADGSWRCEKCEAWDGVEAEPDPADTPAGVTFRQGLRIDPADGSRTRTWIARREDKKASGATKAEALRALRAMGSSFHRAEPSEPPRSAATKPPKPARPVKVSASPDGFGVGKPGSASVDEVKAFCREAVAKGLSCGKALKAFRTSGRSFGGNRFKAVWEVSK